MKNKTKIPSAFCYSKSNVKAFILGADPTNFSKNKQRVELNKVFAIGDGDSRYFKEILANLKLVGLNLENIYVQNLIGEYQFDETSKNKQWNNEAKNFIPNLKIEFNRIDKTKKLPVLITAEKIYKILIDEEVSSKAIEVYNNPETIPTLSTLNKLGRPLIPFYRHKKYSLKLDEWRQYRYRIIEIIPSK